MALLIQFLSQIRVFVQSQNSDELRNWLLVEPNASQQYHQLAAELRNQFRSGNGLEDTVDKCLPEEDDVPEGRGSPWPGFITFMKDYMLFWRDVDYDDLLGAHTLLSGLVNSCSTAFAHPTYGGMLLQTAMSLCESLSRLTMMLSRRPDLTRKIRNVDADDRKSIAETSAEIIQKIFTTCLTDRSSARYSKPEGKKVGVYMFANLVLKLLFAVSFPLPPTGLRQDRTSLTTTPVPKNPPREANLHKHLHKLTTSVPLPGFPARHISLLPRPLQPRKLPLPPRRPLPRGSLPANTASLTIPPFSRADLPRPLQPPSRPPPVADPPLPPGSLANRTHLPPRLPGPPQGRLRPLPAHARPARTVPLRQGPPPRPHPPPSPSPLALPLPQNLPPHLRPGARRQLRRRRRRSLPPRRNARPRHPAHRRDLPPAQTGGLLRPRRRPQTALQRVARLHAGRVPRRPLHPRAPRRRTAETPSQRGARVGQQPRRNGRRRDERRRADSARLHARLHCPLAGSLRRHGRHQEEPPAGRVAGAVDRRQGEAV